jgi:hypothetical protein
MKNKTVGLQLMLSFSFLICGHVWGMEKQVPSNLHKTVEEALQLAGLDSTSFDQKLEKIVSCKKLRSVKQFLNPENNPPLVKVLQAIEEVLHSFIWSITNHDILKLKRIQDLIKLAIALIVQGADPDEQSPLHRETLLHIAAQFNLVNLVSFLLDNSADVTLRNAADQMPEEVDPIIAPELQNDAYITERRVIDVMLARRRLLFGSISPHN